MLGKVDELSMEGENIAIFTVGENIKVIDGPLMVSMEVLKRLMRKRKLEVMVKIFGGKPFWVI